MADFNGLRVRMVGAGSVLAAQAAAATMAACCGAEATPYLLSLSAGLTAVGGVAASLFASDTVASTRQTADRSWNHDLLRAAALAVSDIIRDEVTRDESCDKPTRKLLAKLAAAVAAFYDRVEGDDVAAVMDEQQLHADVQQGAAFRDQPASDERLWTAFLHHVAAQSEIEECQAPGQAPVGGCRFARAAGPVGVRSKRVAGV